MTCSATPRAWDSRNPHACALTPTWASQGSALWRATTNPTVLAPSAIPAAASPWLRHGRARRARFGASALKAGPLPRPSVHLNANEPGLATNLRDANGTATSRLPHGKPKLYIHTRTTHTCTVTHESHRIWAWPHPIPVRLTAWPHLSVKDGRCRDGGLARQWESKGKRKQKKKEKKRWAKAYEPPPDRAGVRAEFARI